MPVKKFSLLKGKCLKDSFRRKKLRIKKALSKLQLTMKQIKQSIKV
jgi:hypothetical protein